MARTHWGRFATPLPFGQFAFGEHGLRYAAPMRSPGPLKAPGRKGILSASNTVQQDLEVLLVFPRRLSKDGGRLIKRVLHVSTATIPATLLDRRLHLPHCLPESCQVQVWWRVLRLGPLGHLSHHPLQPVRPPMVRPGEGGLETLPQLPEEGIVQGAIGLHWHHQAAPRSRPRHRE